MKQTESDESKMVENTIGIHVKDHATRREEKTNPRPKLLHSSCYTQTVTNIHTSIHTNRYEHPYIHPHKHKDSKPRQLKNLLHRLTLLFLVFPTGLAIDAVVVVEQEEGFASHAGAVLAVVLVLNC